MDDYLKYKLSGSDNGNGGGNGNNGCLKFVLFIIALFFVFCIAGGIISMY